MNRFLPIISLCSLALLAMGCSSTPIATGPNQALCYVCKYNNDLGCIHVTVSEKTPRTVYNGKTYYFCSDECHAAFLKRPAKYANK